LFAISLAELTLIGIIIGLIVMVARSTRAGAAAPIRRDEMKLIEEIHLGLARLEERVEALETLLLDRQHKGDTK